MSSAPQTSVDTPQVGLPGAPCDAAAARDNVVRTYVNEEASAHVPFGRGVKLGTADAGGTGTNGAKVLSAKTDKIVGVASFALGFSRATELDDTGILPKTHFGVTEKGGLWITPGENVGPGDQVHVCVTAHAGFVVGQFHKTDDGVYSIDVSKFAQWRTSGGPTTGQPAKLVFDFTNAALAATDS